MSTTNMVIERTDSGISEMAMFERRLRLRTRAALSLWNSDALDQLLKARLGAQGSGSTLRPRSWFPWIASNWLSHSIA